MMGGRVIESDYLPVDNRLVSEWLERADQRKEALREILPIARPQMDPASRLECNRPIAVELQLVFPIGSGREIGYSQARHRLDEMTGIRPTLLSFAPLATRLHLQGFP